MHSTCRDLILRLFAAIVLLAVVASPGFAKGGGVGYWLEGTVSSVRVVDDHIELVIVGRLTLDQYSGGPSTKQSVHYECTRGISALLSQGEPFFAMTPNWRGGALRYKGELGRLGQAALKRGSVMKIELAKPQIDFGDWRCPVVRAEAIRVTDPELK